MCLFEFIRVEGAWGAQTINVWEFLTLFHLRGNSTAECNGTTSNNDAILMSWKRYLIFESNILAFSVKTEKNLEKLRPAKPTA
jgi:hypothetical protein